MSSSKQLPEPKLFLRRGEKTGSEEEKRRGKQEKATGLRQGQKPAVFQPPPPRRSAKDCECSLRSDTSEGSGDTRSTASKSTAVGP